MRKLIGVIALCLIGFTLLVQYLKPVGGSGGKVALQWATGNNPFFPQQVDLFNAEHPELELRLDTSAWGGSDGIQRIMVQASSGVGPDLFDLVSARQLQTYVESGIAWDLTSRAEGESFGLDDTWRAAVDHIVYEDRQYAYPAAITMDLLLFNKNIFDDLGEPYPHDAMTWDEFFGLARRLTHDGPDGPVFGVANLSWTFFFYSLRGEFFTHDGTNIWIAGNDKLKQAFEMHKAALFEHRVMPTMAEQLALSGQGGYGAGLTNQFTDGRYAMYLRGKWVMFGLRQKVEHQLRLMDLREEAEGDAARGRLFRVGSVLPPRFRDRDPAYMIYVRATAINASSPNRDEAMSFLQFLSGERYSEMINLTNGVPGNPAYATSGLEGSSLAPHERELHENTIRAMEYAHEPRASRFILTTEVERVLDEQIGRMESAPSIPVDVLLRDAQEKLERLMERTVARDPELARELDARRGASR